jgi:antitoxin PrlF
MSTLTSKYQATIPKDIRDALGLSAGDRIEFLVDRSGSVSLRKAPVADPELHALEATLAPEWSSPTDEVAYADL